jgi:predicted transport protein
MSDIKLFQINSNKVTELEGKSVTIEKTLQALIEKHLATFLGVTFLATEYSTGIKHGGRIDTLGIDENNCPVIIEYKRTSNENVVNQGLYYLDWLLDHKAEFQMLVLNSKGKNISDNIEWENARLICIAGDYTKYDSYAVEQMNRNIELIRYRKYDNLLLFELVNATSEFEPEKTHRKKSKTKHSNKYKTVAEFYDGCSDDLKNRFEELSQFIFNLGDGIQLKKMRWYFAFKKIRTFASFAFQPVGDTIQMWVHADLSKIKFEKGFTRDVSKIGHHGLGNLEIRIKSVEDLEKSKPFILKSYEMS